MLETGLLCAIENLGMGIDIKCEILNCFWIKTAKKSSKHKSNVIAMLGDLSITYSKVSIMSESVSRSYKKTKIHKMKLMKTCMF